MLRESIRDGRRLNRPAPRATPRAVSERGVNAPHDHEEYQPGERIRTEATSCQHRKGHEAEQGVMLIATANEDASLAVKAVAASLFHRAAPKNEAVILFRFSLRLRFAEQFADIDAESVGNIRQRAEPWHAHLLIVQHPRYAGRTYFHLLGQVILIHAGLCQQSPDVGREQSEGFFRFHAANIHTFNPLGNYFEKSSELTLVVINQWDNITAEQFTLTGDDDEQAHKRPVGIH